MKPYGWGFMYCISFTDGVSNPRPIFLKVHEEGKAGILHYVLGDRKTPCGAYFATSLLDHNGRKVTVSDPYDDTSVFVKQSVICPECEAYWKENEVVQGED